MPKAKRRDAGRGRSQCRRAHPSARTVLTIGLVLLVALAMLRGADPASSLINLLGVAVASSFGRGQGRGRRKVR